MTTILVAIHVHKDIWHVGLRVLGQLVVPICDVRMIQLPTTHMLLT